MKSEIQKDLVKAMKARDKELTSILRLALSELVQAEKAGEQLTAEAEIKTLKGYKKKLGKALDCFSGDRLEALKKEYEIVSSYLPQEASEEEVREVVLEVLSSTKERKIGPLIGQIMKKTNSDGKTISKILKEELK